MPMKTGLYPALHAELLGIGSIVIVVMELEGNTEGRNITK